MHVATVVAWATATIFGSLSALHLYWAVRGVSGGVGLPEVDGKPAFMPSRATTLAVATALAAAALVVLARMDIVLPSLPAWMTRTAAGVLGMVFVLRAIGERNLVGF